MDIPDGLIQQLAWGRVVPFVGSGVSLAVRQRLSPTWSGLLESLAQRLHDEAHKDAAEIVRRYVKKGQLNKAANEVFDELAPAHFREVMQATFGVAQPRDADLALPTALWSLRPRLIVTTNYDRVLQWSNSAARIATNSQRGNLADLFAGSSADQPVVWHLHGHIDDADSLILAPRQYDRLYREATDDKHPYAAARLQLRTLIGNHPLLFVGFGLQDEYVMDALAIWEWCADTFDPARTDAPQAGRVARGGSWLYPGHCRSAVRLDLHPVFGVNFCGFRATRT